MDEPNCGGCRFFRDRTCRRHAPIAQLNEYTHMEIVYTPDSTATHVPVKQYSEPTPVWPVVAMFDWCGEWEKKDES